MSVMSVCQELIGLTTLNLVYAEKLAVVGLTEKDSQVLSVLQHHLQHVPVHRLNCVLSLLQDKPLKHILFCQEVT